MVGTVQVRALGLQKQERSRASRLLGLACPFLPFLFCLVHLPGGPLGLLKGLTGEQRGPTWSIERSYQLPDGPQEGRPAQRDQMAAAAVSRREGEAGRGHGRPWGWRQGVREAEQWAGERRQGMEDCSGDRADVGEVEEEE